MRATLPTSWNSLEVGDEPLLLQHPARKCRATIAAPRAAVHVDDGPGRRSGHLMRDFAGWRCVVQVDRCQRPRRLFGSAASGRRKGRADQRSSTARESGCRKGNGEQGGRGQEAAGRRCGKREEGCANACRHAKARQLVQGCSRRTHRVVIGSATRRQGEREGHNGVPGRRRTQAPARSTGSKYQDELSARVKVRAHFQRALMTTATRGSPFCIVKLHVVGSCAVSAPHAHFRAVHFFSRLAWLIFTSAFALSVARYAL